jgi:hypothetical protein
MEIWREGVALLVEGVSGNGRNWPSEVLAKDTAREITTEGCERSDFFFRRKWDGGNIDVSVVIYRVFATFGDARLDEALNR